MASDSVKSNLYVVASYGGGSPDQLFVLNTSSFSNYSSTNPPPSYLLDYSASYGQVVVDPTSHLAYLPEFGTGSSLPGSGPGFWVFDPSQNKLVRVLGYIDPSTNAQVDVSDLAIFAAGSGKIVIVLSNPTPSSTFQLYSLLELDTTQFSFFSNTQASSGFPSGVYVKPPAAAIINYPRHAQFSNISAASFDPAHGIVYVAADLENSTSQILPQGLLMGYNLATPPTAETLYSDTVPQPLTSSGTTTKTYAGWGQLTFDACANELLLFNSYAGTGSMAITAPLTGSGIAVTPIAFNPFNPVGLVVNQNSGYIYAPSVTAPISPSPGSPEVVFFAPPSTCAGSGGGGGGGGPAPDALTLTNVPASAESGVGFSLNVVLQSSGTGTPTGIVTVVATGSGGALTVTVPAALALAGGSAGTPASLVLPTPGMYTLIATYAGDANFAAATSATYNIEATQPAPASAGLAILIPGIISSQNATTGTANSILSATVFDGAGNFYVLDSGLGQVTEYPVSGSPQVIVPQSGNSITLAAPSDMILEADGASLLISDFGNNRLVRVGLGSTVTITALPQSSVPAGPSACVNPVSGTNLCWPTGLAEDSSGNIYVSDLGNGRVLKLDPFGNYVSTVLSAGTSPLVNPLGLAIDTSGNLYVANSTGTAAPGSILKLPAQGTVQTFLSSNVTKPYGLATDQAGDLYFSDSGSKTVSLATSSTTVYPFAGNGAATDSGDGAPATAAGIAAPLGVSLDAAGNLYIGDSSQVTLNGGVIRKVTASQSALAFGNVTQSTASAPQNITLLNGGGASLSIASAVVSGTNGSDFALTNSCGAQLASAATCALSVIFTPSTTAAESAVLTITDNSGGAATATQVVQLTGTGQSGSGGAQAAATPVFSPASGTYTTPQSVSITSATPNAAIYYTTDGSTPTTGSTAYTAAITVSATETINAIATASGYQQSAVGSATYTFNLAPAATPTFSVPAGSYSSAQTVSISSTTPGAVIYYSTTGGTPATLYSAPLTVSQTETLTAMATAPGYGPSAVASATYLLNASFTMLGSDNGSTPATIIPTVLDIYDSPNTATVTLTLTSVNGFNVPVTLSDNFAPVSQTPNPYHLFGYCSDSTGKYQVSCTVTPTAAGTTVYYTFDEGSAPFAQPGRVSGGTGPGKSKHTRQLVGAASTGLLGSLITMALFGLYWRKHRLQGAAALLSLTVAAVSMALLLSGCTINKGNFKITAAPPGTSTIQPQVVMVTIVY
jgi:sugar lactone lactonase YvrE